MSLIVHFYALKNYQIHPLRGNMFLLSIAIASYHAYAQHRRAQNDNTLCIHYIDQSYQLLRSDFVNLQLS